MNVCASTNQQQYDNEQALEVEDGRLRVRWIIMMTDGNALRVRLMTKAS
jgi:hypothetical protein